MTVITIINNIIVVEVVVMLRPHLRYVATMFYQAYTIASMLPFDSAKIRGDKYKRAWYDNQSMFARALTTQTT